MKQETKEKILDVVMEVLYFLFLPVGIVCIGLFDFLRKEKKHGHKQK